MPAKTVSVASAMFSTRDLRMSAPLRRRGRRTRAAGGRKECAAALGGVGELGVVPVRLVARGSARALRHVAAVVAKAARVGGERGTVRPGAPAEPAGWRER